jgi:hypothetical protein
VSFDGSVGNGFPFVEFLYGTGGSLGRYMCFW